MIILMIAIISEYVLRIMKGLLDRNPYIVGQTIGRAL